MSKFVFLVQGEGRGHLTQAIALASILRSDGHEVAAVMVGLSKGRVIPDFFLEQIQSKVIPFDSPNLVYDSKTKALNISKTLLHGLKGVLRFSKSIRLIHRTIRAVEPDMFINFYDILGGIYNFCYRPDLPMVCVAHQYLLFHHAFQFPKSRPIDKFLVKINTQITALGAKKKLALSFDKFPDDEAQNIKVVPPLLRPEVRNLKAQTPSKTSILVYMTIPSMADELIKWHQKNQKIEVHCFWDKTQAQEEFKYAPNLTFHKINAKKFLEMMQNCSGLATSAGFESVCEAMSLGKPVFMVPVPKHFEQACNALDAERAGAGIQGVAFNLDEFLAFLPQYQNISLSFNFWQNQVSPMFLSALKECLVKEVSFSNTFRFDIAKA